MRDDRIIGGIATSIQKHPYQLSLRLRKNHICGASLVSKTVALTAGHCIISKPTDYSIRAGSSYIDEGGKVMAVTRIVVHPKYKKGSDEYDISIVFLACCLRLSSSIRPIKLPKLNAAVPGGTEAIVSGWGNQVPGVPSAPRTLRSAVVTVYKQDKCIGSFPAGAITETMLCAGAGNLRRDSCQVSFTKARRFISYSTDVSNIFLKFYKCRKVIFKTNGIAG